MSDYQPPYTITPEILMTGLIDETEGYQRGGLGVLEYIDHLSPGYVYKTRAAAHFIHSAKTG